MGATSGGDEFPGAALLAKIVKTFERIVMLALGVLLMVVSTVCTVELGVLLWHDLRDGPLLPLDAEETFEIFGFILLVVVGLELLATLKSYLVSRVFYLEIVVEVAIIAVAQKIIILNPSKADGLSLLGLAGLFAALVGAFWVIRVARSKDAQPAT